MSKLRVINWIAHKVFWTQELWNVNLNGGKTTI